MSTRKGKHLNFKINEIMIKGKYLTPPQNMKANVTGKRI